LKGPYGHFTVAVCSPGGLRPFYYPLGHPTPYAMESGQKCPQTDYRRMARGSHGQGHSQTVNMGQSCDGAQGGPEGGPGEVPRGPQGAPGRVPERKRPSGCESKGRCGLSLRKKKKI
jgi:hypothetical protein